MLLLIKQMIVNRHTGGFEGSSKPTICKNQIRLKTGTFECLFFLIGVTVGFVSPGDRVTG